MSRWFVVGIVGILVFAIVEVVCRVVLHLSDQVVPIAVLPLTALAVGATIGLTGLARSRRR